MFGFKRKPETKKESKTAQASYVAAAGRAQWTKRNFAAFADEAYRKNVVAYQAIDKTAKAVAAIPWLIVDSNGEEITNHPLAQVLKHPNPMQSRAEFVQSIVGFFRIAGNSYIERTISGGRVLELFPLRADRMTPLPGTSGIPRAYTYTVNNSDPVIWDVDPITGQSDVRHMKTFNPLDDWLGMSPIEAGAYGVDQHNEASAHMMGLLQNGAAPSGILSLPAGEELSEEEYNRFKSEIDEKMSGAANRGRPLIGEGGMSWTQMSFSPQAMDIINNKNASARDISLALSVPPLLLNIPGDSTYSNYKEARLAFYEETVIPLASHILDELNVWLAPYLGGATIELDLEECPPIVERRAALWDMANAATDLTINERREMKGYPPVIGGDDIYMPAGNLPLGFEPDEGESTTPEQDGAEAFGTGADDETDEDETAE